MILWLGPRDPFPPVAAALRDPNGLLAAAGDLSVPRLLDAYARGIFPWSGEGEPLLWWSPDPRMVLWLRELHVSRSLRRRIRAGGYTVSLDTAFGDVMRACAAPRAAHHGTWITPAMMEAYTRLAGLGHAHSIEVWVHGALAGGLYGVALGRMFFGESMFSRERDGSKLALVFLVRQLERWGFELLDCQLATAHLSSLGAREISRAEFLRHVERLVRQPAVGAPWILDADLREPAGTM
jgi:leucyl/phenylalanyl-tRNA--protein transferase